MDDFDFTEDEIREQLELLGYRNVPTERLAEFKKDLEQLVRHERSKNSSSSTIEPDTARPVPSGYSVSSSNVHISRPHTSHGEMSSDSQSRHLSSEDRAPPRATIRVPTVPIPSYHRPEAPGGRVQPAAESTEEPSFNTTMDSTASTERRMMKRKVLRKIDGESHIFDESSVTESEDDVTTLQERLRQLPVKVHYDPPSRRPATAPPARHHTYKKPVQETPAYRLSEDFDGPKALIKPMSKPPHEQNLRKMDRVARFQQYNKSWKSQKAPGEKAHKNLRWNVREQMLYHDEVVQKKQHDIRGPNSYVVPTDKKRKNLRWQVRMDLAQGVMPPSILD